MAYFEAKVSLERTSDNGEERKVKETYLVHALSVTEAEAIVISELQSEKEVNVISVKETKYDSVRFSRANDDRNRFYRVKTIYIQVDEKTKREKKTPKFILVEAADFFEAVAETKEYHRNTVLDHEVAAIVETAIVDVLDSILDADFE